MGTYIHIAEVAALLFVAYVAGWLVGYFARRIAAGARQSASIIPAQRLAAVTGEPAPADALVKAPVVVPVSDAPPPPTPAMAAAIEPVKARVTNDGAVVVDAPPIVEAAPVAPPEPVSGLDSLKSLSATMPLMPSDDAPAIEEMVEAKLEQITPPAAVVETPAAEIIAEAAAMPEPPVVADAPASAAVEPVAVVAATVEPAPVAPVEPEPAPAPAMPASAPGVAWAGAINGHEATRFEPPVVLAEEIAIVPSAQSTAPPLDEPFAPIASHDDHPAALPDEPDDEPSAGLDIAVLANLADELKVDTPAVPPAEGVPPPDAIVVAPLPAEPAPTPEPAPVAVAAQPEPQPPAAPAHVEFDESAAMRAIEGGWSRRASRALPDAPEMTDVSAAVSAAQVAVEQVLALNGLDGTQTETRAQSAFGKPRGLGKPRDGGRDDLKRINGLGPLDESTLNNLGIFHLDQIAAWDEREVLWLENHAFARGRIGREQWQAQARDLSGSTGDTARAAR